MVFLSFNFGFLTLTEFQSKHTTYTSYKASTGPFSYISASTFSELWSISLHELTTNRIKST